ncbi:hypothetical protein AQ490_09625 [Wenjunlia vitaminophila]|uniref:Uncharacterized protein n=1 Tax=Wenjunlia vitaminophila TaxID=76728 RepID=A0A0T6LM88_WENVI|nr:hypothetical protein [Wenjunlia vitaminophila]KRV47007.1 hypothetical protein AQ490_09625 [Wenjunlia vitaminophila]
MDRVIKAAVAARIAVRDWAVDRVAATRSGRGDRGQTAIEYLGIAVIVAAIILALNGTDIGNKIKNGITGAINDVIGDS